MRILISLILLLVGCGTPAEAKPFKGERILIRLAIVGESIHPCDAFDAWRLAHAEFIRVLRGQVSLDYEFDVVSANDRPELLTVESFWDSSLGNYWRSAIQPEPRAIRHVALPPLRDASGRALYGGMHYGRGVLGSWFFTNVEPGNDCRNAFTLTHELAHSFDVPDSCNGTRPNVMCASDAAVYRDCQAPIRFDSIQERQIRRSVGLSAGKVLVIGGRR